MEGLSVATLQVLITVHKVHPEHMKHALFLGESGGMPPRKFVKNKYSKVNLEAILAIHSNEIVSSYVLVTVTVLITYYDL